MSQTRDTSPLDQTGPRQTGATIFAPTYREYLADQIVHSLKRTEKANTANTAKTPDGKKDSRGESSLAAWTGLNRDSDAVEAMISAQLIVTHELTMATITEAIACSDGARILLSNDLNDVCKMTRATMHQVETLARYRTWRRRTEADARQQKLEGLDIEDAP